MVATRLLEVTTKGSEWVNSKSTTPPSGNDSSHQSDINSVISYWNDATTSLQDMASNTIGSMVSSFYGGGKYSAINQITGHTSHFHPVVESTSTNSLFNWWNWNSNSSASNISGNYNYYYDDNAEGGTDYEDEDDFVLRSYSTPRSISGSGFQPNHRRRSSILAYSSSNSPWQGNTSRNATPHSDLVWMFRNNKNPYNAVRGRETQLSSFTAVRSLVALVSATNFSEPSKAYDVSPSTSSMIQTEPDTDTIRRNETDERYNVAENLSSVPPPPPLDVLQNVPKGISTPSETASQLAEGTIRALRDIALEEAVELQVALRYWNYRWERPLLSWLEAGPFVWTSTQGYNHQEVGRKVSQIQAVLARRCAAVGELQQHLLRAGWHRGVAQWGVLGQGGHWAPVAGFDGAIPEASEINFGTVGATAYQDEAFSPELSTYKTTNIFRRSSEHGNAPILPNESSVTIKDDVLGNENFDTISERVGGKYISRDKRATSQAHVFVGKKHGDGIYVDDPAFLAEWSVDAIKLIRKQLRRAGNGRVLIPFENNWSDNSQIPCWASESTSTSQGRNRSADADGDPTSQQPRVTITDIPLLTAEVSALLDIMENVMEIQRFRRLEQLRAPSWLRSNWYVVASVVPLATLFIRRLSTTGYGRETVMFFFERVVSFFRERVVDPVAAIFNEVWQGRESFSDKKARMEAIESLKKMIRSWLDDTFPEMPESDRIAMAEAMDVSMIERKKEESMKTFYEINNVIRMSFIEMQYMKKEMMNALHAIDEMMSANDINMNMAAITPAVLLVYGSAKFFKFLFYALLKIGKSKEETYASFRLILTDIERLLVMRDNPPSATSGHYDRDGDSTPAGTMVARPCVLCADDLGMLMLLIHECRSILYRDRRRFTDAIIRSVAEDLAELAGERGAVSVQQQLRIVGRMCRTYPFLKVISIGHLFQYEGLRHI